MFDSIDSGKWYSVKESATFENVKGLLGFSEDKVIRQIKKGFLRAFILPTDSDKRRRGYNSYRILGRDLIRYIKTYMNWN